MPLTSRFVAAILAACVAVPVAITAEEQLLDGIAAVVGDEIILVSEVEAYMLSRLNEAKMAPDSANSPALRKKFLDELIDGRILLAHAKKDSTIVLKNEDVEQALEGHVGRIMAENGLSAEAFEQELAKQGLSLVKFKSQLRKAIREQLMKQRVQQSYLSSVAVTKKDVQNFYQQYRDSLPRLGESVRLLKLTIDVVPSDSVRQTAYNRITSIKARLTNGEPFADVARKFSDDPNAANGGDLGFVAKGTLTEIAFEEKAFALEPGQISEPFETRLGFHIVTVSEKKNQMVHLSQIFVRVAPTEAALRTARARLDSVRTACSSRDCFVTAIKKFCTDPQLVSRSGDIGWYTVGALPKQYEDAFDSVRTGAVSTVIEDGNTFTLLMVGQKVPSRTLTLEDDWDVLAEKAKDIQVQKRLISLVRKWRQDIFVDVRL